MGRDLNQEGGLVFRVNRMHIQDDRLQGLAENETWVWTLKVRSDAKFMPNAAAQTSLAGGVGECHVEDSAELKLNDRSHRWSSYHRDILINGISIKQKMIVVDVAGCEFVNECNPHYVPREGGKPVKAVKVRYANGSARVCVDGSQLKPRDAKSMIQSIVSDAEQPATWTNVTRRDGEAPDILNREYCWPLNFLPNMKGTRVVQHEGQL